MNTEITSKLAAFAVALMMNCLIMGAMAQLFAGRIAEPATAGAMERAAAGPPQGAA
jgi:hypothetical protein